MSGWRIYLNFSNSLTLDSSYESRINGESDRTVLIGNKDDGDESYGLDLSLDVVVELGLEVIVIKFIVVF